MGINEVVKILKSANKIALFCHVNPDGDTICSALSLALGLEKTGKTVDVFCDGTITGAVRSVAHADRVRSDLPQAKDYDVLVAVDCGDEGRVGKYAPLFRKARLTACIDHHKQLGSFAAVNYVDTTAGATAELIFLILQEIDPALIDADIATLLYTGLVTDTGCFSFSNVTERTMKIGSALLAKGVKNADITYIFFKEIPMKTFRLKARALAKEQDFEDDKIGVISFLMDDFDATGTTSSDSSNLVNEIVNISGVEIAVSITEVRKNSYKVSLRTHDTVDASRIANVFGGGGHKNAAGFMLNGFYGNVLDDILKACKDNL